MKELGRIDALDLGMRAIKFISMAAGKLCVAGAAPSDSAKTAFHSAYWSIMPKD